MKRVVLIHGNGGGKGTDNWLPYVKSELEKLGISCEAPDMPDPELARAEYWLPFLQNTLKVDESTILVGHSSGAVAALRYAEENQICGSVLVGAYYTDLGCESEKQSDYLFDNQRHLDRALPVGAM